MDSGSFGRDIGNMIGVLFPLALVGILAVVAGIIYVFYAAFSYGGWWVWIAGAIAGVCVEQVIAEKLRG